MILVSVTRLRLRSWRFLPAFLWHSFLSVRQVKRTPGFLGGRLASDRGGGFWTITLWQDYEAMRRYRNSEAHARAMPHLLDWSDEASFVHWNQEGTETPSLAAAAERMQAEGVTSKVRHPSEAHARKAIVLPGRPRHAQWIRARR